MAFLELLLIAIGLSMDAFAVSVGKGLSMRTFNIRIALILALFFGGFQALMPVIGWAIGSQFLWVIEPIDHWIAFILLGGIGSKMIWDAFHDDDSSEEMEGSIPFSEYVILAIATSIDALAVGISFAALKVDIAVSAATIGVITFLLSLAGVCIGNRFGMRYERGAQVFGGVVLIAIGCKILFEHLGFI